LNAPGLNHPKLSSEKLVSPFAFKWVNLYRYTAGLHASAAVPLSSVLTRCEAPPRAAALGIAENGEEEEEEAAFAGAPRATDTASSASSQFAPFTVSRAGDAAAPATGLTLRFTSRARIYATLPAAAAADGGGTVVAVHGRDFRDGMSGSARCAFGTITVTAAIQNSTRVECVAPTHAEATVSFAFTAHAQRLLGAQERLEFSFV
jgi:hypothetical protein